MATELKPCPFCGGEAVMHVRFNSISKYADKKTEIPKGAKYVRSIGYPHGRIYHEYQEKIFIPRCLDTTCVGRNSKYFPYEKSAIEAWNRRVSIKVETSFYDKEETFPDCTVQVLTNTATGETSVGWWKNDS